VRQALYGSSVGRWRNYARHLERVSAAFAHQGAPH